MFRHSLPLLTEHFTVLGHGHPRILRSLRSHYDKLGIETVEDFDEVLERAAVYVCDNSSTLFEFASLDRPVVLLNAPWYRRDVEHGLRFWRHANIGPQVEDPARLVDGVYEALDDGLIFSKARLEMADDVYPLRDGLASVRAAAAIRNLVSEPDALRVAEDRRLVMPNSDPYAPKRRAQRPFRLPEARPAAATPEALTGVVTAEYAGRLLPGTVGFALFVALSHLTASLLDENGQEVHPPEGRLDDPAEGLVNGWSEELTEFSPLPPQAGTTVESITDWVGEDKYRARWAMLNERNARSPRSTLLRRLAQLVDGEK